MVSTPIDSSDTDTVETFVTQVATDLDHTFKGLDVREAALFFWCFSIQERDRNCSTGANSYLF